MRSLSLAIARPHTFRLGAEELIELGQNERVRVSTVSAPSRTVLLSKEEAGLLLQIARSVKAFAQDPQTAIEFQAYCPPERWKKTLEQVGTWAKEIERQIQAGALTIAVPAEAVFRLVDLEKCVSAAKDERLQSARWAFGLAAVGSIANFVFGVSWLGVPTYIAGLGILFGKPLLARLKADPDEPYRPAILGDCKPDMGDIGDHTDKKKVLERVIVAPTLKAERHHWGTVVPSGRGAESATCLMKGRFRVRVEGHAGDRVEAAEGWERAPIEECEARKEIAVWEPCARAPRETSFGPVPRESGHDETYWIDYVGPLTGGTCRRAGPFG